MRLRLGLTIGFAGGYYLGAKAGRQRYEQINRFLQRAKESDTFDTVSDKAKAVVDLGVERAKDIVDGSENGSGGAGVDLTVTTPNGTAFPARP